MVITADPSISRTDHTICPSGSEIDDRHGREDVDSLSRQWLRRVQVAEVFVDQARRDWERQLCNCLESQTQSKSPGSRSCPRTRFYVKERIIVSLVDPLLINTVTDETRLRRHQIRRRRSLEQEVEGESIPRDQYPENHAASTYCLLD